MRYKLVQYMITDSLGPIISPSSFDGKSDTDLFIYTVFVTYKKWLWFSHIFITSATSL